MPTASRYVASGDHRRMRELVLRGSRYTLALFVPVCVTLMALAEPLLRAWLGDRYGEGAAALTILVSYWLLYGALVVTPGFLVGAGKAREVALIMSAAAAAQHRPVADPDPGAGPRGPGAGHRRWPSRSPSRSCCGSACAPVGSASGSWPARPGCPPTRWALRLAGALVALRLAAEPTGLAAVDARPGLLGVVGYWLAYYALFLDPGERALVRGLLRRG